jgi:hypothetical protein
VATQVVVGDCPGHAVLTRVAPDGGRCDHVRSPRQKAAWKGATMDRRSRRYWWVEAVGVIVILVLFWVFGIGPPLAE